MVCIYLIPAAFADVSTSTINTNVQLIQAAQTGVEIFALPKAAYEGNFEEVKALIAKGADVNAKWPKDLQYAPLHFAASEGNENIRRIFNAAGLKELGEVKDRTKSVDYPRSYTNIVSLLLAGGADINAKGRDGMTPLLIAAWFGNKDTTELLVAKGADMEAKEVMGMTPLLAVTLNNNNKDIENLLITKGAKVDIFTASAMGDIERVKDFLKDDILWMRTDTVNTTTTNGFTPLHYAAYGGENKMAKFLIEKGADVNAGYPGKPTPLYWAALKGHTETVKLLLGKGAVINNESSNSLPTLFAAVWGGNKEVVDVLIAKGANVNVKDREGSTPLWMAAQNRQLEIARLLLDKGADINAKKSNGISVLEIASFKDHTNIVKLLLEKGADARANDRNELLLGSPGDEDFLTGQWNGRESFNPSAVLSGKTFHNFRWTAGEAGIRWPIVSGHDYHLQLSCLVNKNATEPNIFVNGQYIATIRGTGWQFPDVPIPAKLLAGSSIALVKIKSRTWIPANIGESGDARELGVMVLRCCLTMSPSDAPVDQKQIAF